MFDSSEKTFIIVATHDLPYLTSQTDSDCATDSFLAESDCACPDDGFAWQHNTALIFPTTRFVLPLLHTQTLQDNTYLAFNPQGEAGVVVINQATHDLLNIFTTPHTLTEVAAATALPTEALTAVHRLAALGLIEPVGSPSRAASPRARTLTAWLHVTNQCNLRCPYCYLHKSPSKMDLERGIAAIEAVLRSALANGFQRAKLKYAGGESTLNFPLVLSLHDYAQQRAVHFGLELEGVLLSNGVMWTDTMIKALHHRNLRLMISLDGVGEYHDTQRPFINGRGSWYFVERSLDKLAATDLRPSISITLSNRNLEGLPQVVKYVLHRQLPFTINFYRENECSASLIDLSYQDEQIIAAMKEAFAVVEEHLPPYSLLGTLVDRARLDGLHDRPCGVGHSYMVIDQNGGVAKCQMEIEQTITDISVSDPLSILRNSPVGVQNNSVDEKEGCRDCTWRYWCAGGCPALTYRVTGRFDVKSPNCHIYQTLFPEVLRLEGLRLLKYSSIA